MLHRFDNREPSEFTRLARRRRRKNMPRVERLEARSLLASPVDLGEFDGLAAVIFGSPEGSSVSGVDSNAEVVGQKAPSSDPSAYQAFFLDNNGVTHNIGPESGYTASFATALNDSDQISGYSEVPSGDGGIGATPTREAFLYSQGTLKDLGTLGGTDSLATSLNDSGQVVGYSTTSASVSSPTNAFLYSQGSMLALPPGTGYSDSYATGINDAGTIVGYLATGTSSPVDHAAHYTDGNWTDLGTLAGYPDSYATGINDSGQIVGYSSINTSFGSNGHAFLWSQGNGMQDLGSLPGYLDSYATAINDSGQIVGYAVEPHIGSTIYHAFLDANGQMTDLNSLLPANSGWVLLTATAINDQGVIGGMGSYHGVAHGYLLSTSGGGGTGTHEVLTSLHTSSMSTVYGQQVTLSATVTAESGSSGTPTGSVTFYDGTLNLGTVPLSGGSATLPFSDLPVGTDAITAEYSGDSVFAASTSTPVDVTVKLDGTSVSLKSSASQADAGEAITFTAMVSPDAPGGDTPTGSVTFYDAGNDNLGGATLTGGTATLTIHNLPVGTDAITAGYNGDTDFVANISSPLHVTINPATGTSPDYGSVTILTASNRVATIGQPVKLTATVKPAAAVRGTPSGNVTFMDGTTSLGAYPLKNGRATLTISTLPLGPDAIQVIYSGDQQLLGSPSNIVDETIEPSPTRTSASSSRKSSVYGQPVTFTAKLSTTGKAKAVPTGSVSFLDGSTILGTIPLSSGRASFQTSLLAAGTHDIRMVYNRTAEFASSSASLKQRVKQANLSIAKVSRVRVRGLNTQSLDHSPASAFAADNGSATSSSDVRSALTPKFKTTMTVTTRIAAASRSP